MLGLFLFLSGPNESIRSGASGPKNREQCAAIFWIQRQDGAERERRRHGGSKHDVCDQSGESCQSQSKGSSDDEPFFMFKFGRTSRFEAERTVKKIASNAKAGRF